MKKQIIILLIVVGMLIGAGGCASVKLDGFSVGVMYLNTDLTTTSTHNVGGYQFSSEQNTGIEAIVPTFSLNFKFK